MEDGGEGKDICFTQPIHTSVLQTSKASVVKQFKDMTMLKLSNLLTVDSKSQVVLIPLPTGRLARA